MNFQLALIKRRGRFGTVWLAAHHPGKVSKSETVQINIAKKCNEIIEYIVNGKENRPKLSLFISSHLMLGLCVLIKKQSQYLLDDLIHLRQEIHKCYINQKLVIKKPKETPKKTTGKTPKKGSHAEKAAITLKENLPILMTNLETFYEQENERLRDALQETVEKLSVSRPQGAISLIEENLDTIVQGEDFQFEDGLLLAPDNLQDTFFNIENLEKTKLTSTVKFDQRIQPRIPFKELSTNEQVRRAELTTSMAQELETDIYADLESLLNKKTADTQNIPPSVSRLPVQMPELYQETIVEPLAPEALAEETIQIQQEQVMVPGPAPSEEIPSLVLPSRRIKKQKKRGLIIDEITEFSGYELSKRIRRDAEEKNLVELFNKNRLEMKLNFDFLKRDLLKEANNLMMRKTSRTYSRQDSNRFVKNVLIHSNLKSAKLSGKNNIDHTTDAMHHESRPFAESERSRQMSESMERGRKRQSTSRFDAESVRISSKLMKSKDVGLDSRLYLEESNTVQFQEQIQEQIELEVPALFPSEAPPLISIRPPSLERSLEMNEFEKILRNELRKREIGSRVATLQDLIREIDISELAVSNRRKLGIKLFQQVLTMCKDNSLKAEQTCIYGAIKLQLV